jgi:hypothetical protein
MAATPDFVRRVVTTIKPRLAVENRSEIGLTLPLLQGLNENSFGRLIVCGSDAEACAALRKETAGFDVSPSVSVDLRDQSALKSQVDGVVDLLVCTDDHEQVVRHLLPQVNPFGLILLHAGAGEYGAMREFLFRAEKEGILSVVELPETLRLGMAQKRSGRK